MSWSAKPDDDGADGGGRQELVLEDERGDEHQQADDHRVLEDRRERVRHAIGAQRVDERVDEQVDDGRGEDEPFEAAAVAAEAGQELGPLPDDEIEEDVAGEEERARAGASAGRGG